MIEGKKQQGNAIDLVAFVPVGRTDSKDITGPLTIEETLLFRTKDLKSSR